MDDIEFEPYDSQNLKRIGTKEDHNQEDKSVATKKNSGSLKYIFIVILLIATISFFSYKYYQNTVLYPKQTKAELLDIRNSLYTYKENFGFYPTQLTELVKSRPLRETWLTDAWENAYRYKMDDNKQTFVVMSSGSDGKFGTDDDIKIDR